MKEREKERERARHRRKRKRSETTEEEKRHRRRKKHRSSSSELLRDDRDVEMNAAFSDDAVSPPSESRYHRHKRSKRKEHHHRAVKEVMEEEAVVAKEGGREERKMGGDMRSPLTVRGQKLDGGEMSVSVPEAEGARLMELGGKEATEKERERDDHAQGMPGKEQISEERVEEEEEEEVAVNEKDLKVPIVADGQETPPTLVEEEVPQEDSHLLDEEEGSGEGEEEGISEAVGDTPEEGGGGVSLVSVPKQPPEKSQERTEMVVLEKEEKKVVEEEEKEKVDEGEVEVDDRGSRKGRGELGGKGEVEEEEELIHVDVHSEETIDGDTPEIDPEGSGTRLIQSCMTYCALMWTLIPTRINTSMYRISPNKRQPQRDVALR